MIEARLLSRSIGAVRLLIIGFGVIALTACSDGQSLDQQAPEQEAKNDWPLIWRYAEGSCQNTETRVLIDNAANLITWADPEACEIAAGAWQSWGADVVLPLHMTWVVPLVTPGHAQAHGATDWTRERQIDFINDRDNLIILDPVSAKERGDLSPVGWTPLPRFWCEYATRWQQVKARYGLSIEVEEGKALAKMLESCPPPQDAATSTSD